MASSSRYQLVLYLVALSVTILNYCCYGHLGGGHGRSSTDEKPDGAGAGSALFIFGDSLFDAGNNNNLPSDEVRANFWPYGESFFKYGTGRFSNGRLIVDFIANFAKLPLIPPYLQLENNSYYGHGVNFASAGAGVLDETHKEYGITNMKTQVSYLKNVRKILEEKLGDIEAESMLSNAIYLVNFGSNDYTTLFSDNITMNYTQAQYVGMVVTNFTARIKDIYELGGRKFGFLNLPALGCVPNVKILKPKSEEGECYEEVTAIAKLHNKYFSEALPKLESQLEGFKYSYFDIYTLYNDRMNNPTEYGFKVGNAACCGLGLYRGTYDCGRDKVYELCNDTSEYFFFDSAHPSQNACLQFAELMWNGTSNTTAPYNLKALFEDQSESRYNGPLNIFSRPLNLFSE